MPSRKIIIRIILNTLLGLVLVFVWLKFVNIEEILKTLSKVNPLSLLPIFFFFTLSNAIRSLKLKIFLQKEKNIPLKELFFINGVAIMLNFLIPIRAGEIAKGVYLSQNFKLPMAKSLVWIFLDRFIDFVVVFIAAAVMLSIIPTTLGPNIIYLSAFLAAILLLLLYLIVYKHTLAKKIFSFLETILIFTSLKKIFHKTSEFFLETFQVLKRPPKDLIYIFTLSVLAYFSDAAIWVYSFSAIGVSEDIFKMFLAQLLSALTYLIPAAPGYVGSAEASGLLIFSGVFGIDANIASSMTVLFHMCAAIFVIAFGFISLQAVKFNLSEVWSKLKNNSN